MNRINDILKEWNMECSDRQISQFKIFYDLLTEWNSKMNLTTITDPGDVILKHFADSLALAHFLPLKDQKMIDLGTGAGFPGIPLKIFLPDLQITLADSLLKRLRFLDTVIQDLGLNGIKTVHGRAEDLARQAELRDSFDLCVSRAVANMRVLCEYCLPFVRTGGSFIAYKGADCESEISDAREAIRLLGGGAPEVRQIPQLGHSLVIIRKTDPTPSAYPRKAGTPARRPL